MEVEWRKLRADELRDAAKSDSIVLLPVAALEQHGPHLPVETDSAIAEALAGTTAHMLAERDTRALVLPPVWAGLSERHMDFGGTVTLRAATLCALIEDICVSVQRQGFRRMALINAHGGNDATLRGVVDDLSTRLSLTLALFMYHPLAARAIEPLLTTQRTLMHACEGETAMMLALRPKLVAIDRVPARTDPPAGGATLYRWRSMSAQTTSGVLGNPEAGNAVQGRHMLDAVSTLLADRLADPTLWDGPTTGTPPA